jgi:UDP-glucuronate 4-epimerase
MSSVRPSGDGWTLITGAAGFIGFHLARSLAADGLRVIGIDHLPAGADLALKRARLAELAPFQTFEFEPVDITDAPALARLFESRSIDRVVHLAGRAGVRASFVEPQAYAITNIIGFLNLLETLRRANANGRSIKCFYASSSSVYGDDRTMPSPVASPADRPLSLYAATKRANELTAYVYARQFGLDLTGLRFFTVYGPWGRPDMAAWLFTDGIIEGRPIELFNRGEIRRDFTYIDDVIESMRRLFTATFGHDSDDTPHRLIDIGRGRSEPLGRFVEVLEEAIGIPAELKLREAQAGDVALTCADQAPLQRAIDWSPAIGIEEGVPRFVAWFREWRLRAER